MNAPASEATLGRASRHVSRINALAQAASLVLSGSGLPLGSLEAREIAENLLDTIADLGGHVEHDLDRLIG